MLACRVEIDQRGWPDPRGAWSGDRSVNKMSTLTSTNPSIEDRNAGHASATPTLALAVLLGLIAVLFYSYYNSLSALWLNYWNSAQYSHGYIVPVLAIVLLWMRWNPSLPATLNHIATSARWYGAALLFLGIGLRLAVARMGMETPDMLSFIPCLAGILLMAGGWPMFKWGGPVVLYLAFMFPIPHRIQQAILVPLKTFATQCSYYLLQATGFEAYREGNIIFISGIPMGVVDACSGLRMLTVFLALCTAVAMIINRPLWERIFIVLSALPIAVTVNVLRISSTGIAYHYAGEQSEWVHYVFHDNAGLMMMPLAMLFLYLEITVIGMVFLDKDPDAGETSGHRTGKRAASKDIASKDIATEQEQNTQ